MHTNPVLTSFKCQWNEIFYFLIWKSFQNDKECCFFCGNTLGYWVRLLVKSQCGHKVVSNHKKLNVSHYFFCIELKLGMVQLLHLSQSCMICPLWHFRGNTMGSRHSSFNVENQNFPSSRSVICYCWRKSVKLWSNNWGSFHFRNAEVW